MPRYRVLLEASVQSTASQHAVGCLGVLALVPAIAAGVNLVAGDQAPRELVGTTPWFVLAAVICGGLTALVWTRARRRLRLLLDEDRGLAIKVADTLYRGPFTCEYGYMVQRIKGIPMCHLTLHVYGPDDKHILCLHETWGAAYGRPRGWREQLCVARGEPGAVWQAAAGRFVDELREEIEARG